VIEVRQTPQNQSLERSSCVVLLGGGDKSSQRRDIRRAKALVRDL
jgi:putative component of toxin-antitoxin plasmid stabilization module